jgi:hypothetical protein
MIENFLEIISMMLSSMGKKELEIESMILKLLGNSCFPIFEEKSSQNLRVRRLFILNQLCFSIREIVKKIRKRCRKMNIYDFWIMLMMY